LASCELAEIRAGPVPRKEKIVCLRQRMQPAGEALRESLRRRRRAKALLRDGEDHGERIVDAMGKLAQEQMLTLQHNFLGGFAERDVLKAIDATDHLAFVVVQGIEIAKEGQPRAVSALDLHLAVADRVAGGKQRGHGRFDWRQRFAVRAIDSVGAAIPVAMTARGRCPAPKLGRTAIVVNEISVEIAGADADGQAFEKAVPRSQRRL
jgi:hypothetical protein